MEFTEEKKSLIDYEVAGSWWAWMVPARFSRFVASYFVGKVNRKYGRSQRVMRTVREQETRERWQEAMK